MTGRKLKKIWVRHSAFCVKIYNNVTIQFIRLLWTLMDTNCCHMKYLPECFIGVEIYRYDF